MTERWQKVTAEQAQQHRLYGIRGWLIVFALGLLFGLLRELATVNAEALDAGTTMGQFFSLDHPIATFVKTALGLQALIVAAVYCLLLGKHPRFRNVTSAQLLGSWPAVALLGAFNPFPGLAHSLTVAFFSWAISCAVWVTYLQRSKRVRVTFENCLASDEAAEVHQASSSKHREPIRAPMPSSGAPATRVVPSDRPMDPTEQTHSMTLTPEEDFWSIAAAEVDGPSRRVGLWAKAFAEAQANEALAKAHYLKWRVAQLRSDDVLRNQRAEEARVAHEEQQRQAALAERSKLNGECPSCGRVISLSEVKCPHCRASFGPGSAYKLLPLRRT